MYKRLKIKAAKKEISKLRKTGKILVPQNTADIIEGLLSNSTMMTLKFEKVYNNVVKITKEGI
ncbi:MAG: hypothetical protein ACQEQF_00265 [Bacillota bacterium]